MAETLERTDLLILLVLEAHADIDTGEVLGPHGHNFALADITALSKVSRSQLSQRIAHLEARGYLSVVRQTGRGHASRYTLTKPI